MGKCIVKHIMKMFTVDEYSIDHCVVFVLHFLHYVIRCICGFCTTTSA